MKRNVEMHQVIQEHRPCLMTVSLWTKETSVQIQGVFPATESLGLASQCPFFLSTPWAPPCLECVYTQSVGSQEERETALEAALEEIDLVFNMTTDVILVVSRLSLF